MGFQYTISIPAKSYAINLKPSIPSNQSYFPKQNHFQFLNQSQPFSVGKIDWNDEKTSGKLWAYNLNYFDFLNQENLTVGEGLALIQDYLKKGKNLETGFEPYPMSLRGINWIKFLSKNKIQNPEIDTFLMAQYVRLSDNLEYHLMGNHLLENAFSLLFGAYYFRNESFLKLSYKIFQAQLPEQILEDGGHFERSPMYHQIILFRVLDCLNLVSNNENFEAYRFDEMLTFYGQKMLNFLQNITFKNGDIPLVNDAAKSIAPTTKQLVEYAQTLNLYQQLSTIQQINNSKLSASGYRKFEHQKFELLMDVGDICPDYQPAHAHCDTLSFVLYIHEKPFIVDTGTSTYQNNEIRKSERSTSAHNTVQIGAFEQSAIWSSFRVGRRAKAKILLENHAKIMATHDGYKHLGITHERSYIIDNQQIIIKDRTFGVTDYTEKAYLHFHPDVKVEIIGNSIKTNLGNITFENVMEIEQCEYFFCEEFNKRRTAIVLTLLFQKYLITVINSC